MQNNKSICNADRVIFKEGSFIKILKNRMKKCIIIDGLAQR